MIRRPPISTRTDTLFPYTTLFRSIDARIDIELGKALVDVFGPALAPLLDQFGAVPVAHLRAEAININLAQRQHHVRVRFGEAISTDVPVHIEIGDHAKFAELTFDEVSGQGDALRLVDLARDRKPHPP